MMNNEDNARLYLEAFLRLLSEERKKEKFWVRMPDGEIAELDSSTLKGRQGIGALLIYAIAGREGVEALRELDVMEETEGDRQRIRLYSLARQLFDRGDDAALFSLESVLQRIAGSQREADREILLPGIVTSKNEIKPKIAWAGEKKIIWFSLPDGIPEASVNGQSRNAAECERGLPVSPEVKELDVEWEGGSARVPAEDPWHGARCCLLMRIGPLCVPIRWIPKRFRKRLRLVVRITGMKNADQRRIRVQLGDREWTQTPKRIREDEYRIECPGMEGTAAGTLLVEDTRTRIAIRLDRKGED